MDINAQIIKWKTPKIMATWDMNIGGLHILTNRGRLKSKCWNILQNKNGSLCRLFADTGNVMCSEDLEYAVDPGYLVPKSCVEWKMESDHMTRAFYREIKIEIPQTKGNTDF